MEIVYIDMDGVLCDYNAAKNEALKRNPEQKFPQSENFYKKQISLPVFYDLKNTEIFKVIKSIKNICK